MRAILGNAFIAIKEYQMKVAPVLDVLLGSVESLPDQSSRSSGNISEAPPAT